MKSNKPKAPVMIPVENLVPFDGHPYKVLDDDSMNDLTESIQESGILEPLTVRPLENTDNYEIISGHRRYNAAKKAYGFIGGKYSQDRRMEDGYFDCSALVWRAYKAADYYLAGETKYAPTAADLAKKLESDGKAIAYEYVDASELMPGDLIFYSSSSNGRYKNIDHVAMYYAAGNLGYSEFGYDYYYDSEYNAGIMIHATSPSVHMTNYSDYIPYRIVMICRPVD